MFHDMAATSLRLNLEEAGSMARLLPTTGSMARLLPINPVGSMARSDSLRNADSMARLHSIRLHSIRKTVARSAAEARQSPQNLARCSAQMPGKSAKPGRPGRENRVQPSKAGRKHRCDKPLKATKSH